jgi:hypothetical protein
MVPNTKENRKKLLRLGGELLQHAGSAMQQETEVEQRYVVLARELSNLGSRLTSQDSTANVQVIESLGAGSKHIGTLLPKIKHADAIQPEQIAGLIDAVSTTGEAIISFATGLAGKARPGRSGKHSSQAEKAENLAAHAGDAAFELYLSAEYLRHSVGLPPDTHGFEYPHACGCGCGGGSSSKTIPPARKKKDPEPIHAGPPIQADIKDALRNLKTASRVIPEFLHASGLFLATTTLICDDLCLGAPSLSSCTFGGVNSQNDGVNWVPTFTVTWTGCCTCACLVWKRDEPTTWTTTHTVTPAAAIPNTRPKAAADALAKRAGAAEVDAYNASFFPPAPPAGKPAPAPPPFKPNAAINPALNGVGCPAKC